MDRLGNLGAPSQPERWAAGHESRLKRLASLRHRALPAAESSFWFQVDTSCSEAWISLPFSLASLPLAGALLPCAYQEASMP